VVGNEVERRPEGEERIRNEDNEGHEDVLKGEHDGMTERRSGSDKLGCVSAGSRDNATG
jgi:hypothetical protein